MKTAALKRFRKSLSEDEPVYGLWVTLESASLTEMAVALGLDWVVIDAEHGHLDWKEIVEHIRAAVRSDTVVLVRIAESNAALIKRVLDIGADRVIETAALGVHGYQQRPEVLDAELPQAFRVEVVHVDVHNLFNPGGFQGRRAADDSQIDSP